MTSGNKLRRSPCVTNDRDFREEQERRGEETMAGNEVKLGSSKPMIATRQEMVDEKVPMAFRDQCAHLLIPLNKCRSAEFFLPWKCENERHTYEKCEYELVMERMLQMQKIRQLEEERLKEQKQTQKGGIPLIPSTANA